MKNLTIFLVMNFTANALYAQSELTKVDAQYAITESGYSCPKITDFELGGTSGHYANAYAECHGRYWYSI